MADQIINYMPQRYHHRHRIWRGPVILTSVAAGIVVLFRLRGISVNPLVAALILGVVGVILIRTALITSSGNWECIIDAGVLSWQIPRFGWSELQLTELAEVVTVNYPNEENWPQYELVTTKGDRVVLDWQLINSDSYAFKYAILTENPEVIFSSRNGNLCYKCGSDLHVRIDRCPQCETVIPGENKIVSR